MKRQRPRARRETPNYYRQMLHVRGDEDHPVDLVVARRVPRAADRLGMAPVSLSRWIDRREQPRIASGRGVTHAAR